MKELWQCPHCGRKFPNKNQWHSCEILTLDFHFGNKPAEIRELFDRFVEEAEKNGPVTVHISKTQISLQVRMHFAVIQVRKSFLQGYLVLARRVEDYDRFYEVLSPSKRNHVHRFRISKPGDIDKTFKSYMTESYMVGNQEHLK